MKKTLMVLVVITVMVGGPLYYLWRQVTVLPGWYKSGAEEYNDGPVILYGKGMETIRRSLAQHIEDQAQKTPVRSRQIEIVLDENDVNRLFASIVSENASKYPYLKAIKASKTRIKDGNLDFAVVANLLEIVGNIAGHRIETARSDGIHLPGFLKEREISLGFNGKFAVRDGRLTLDERGTIRIGALSFTLESVLKRLGISRDKIKVPLQDLEVGRFNITNIQAVKNTLLLKVSF